jgi:BirA family biotin operon repressor/biotin-[acetyl-CoA-carboxylase] ligase
MPMEHWARLTHACALAASEMLERVPELPGPQIKWPNDVYLSGRKVCGILVESALDARGGFAVAGAGINLNLTTGDLPESLHGTATSVWLERGGQEICREDCAADFILRLMANVQRAALDFPALLAECERRSFLTGRVIRVHQGDRIIEGLAAGLGPAGELLLRTDDSATHAITTADLVRPV